MNLLRFFPAVCCLTLLTACSQQINGQKNPPAQMEAGFVKPDIRSLSDPELRDYADELAHRFIITDGHVDLPYRLTTRFFKLYREYVGIPVESKEGDFDYVRAKKGGLDAPFMSIYIPSEFQKTGGAKVYADSLISMVEKIAAEHNDKFALAGSPDEIEANFKNGKISLPMGMENGAPIQKLDDVDYYFKKGIRYITLTHSKDNKICDSSYDTAHTNGGLSKYGKKVVKEMNRAGIMVDISHVSDSAFYQVLRTTKAPVIASHSSCRKFTPGWQRNMSDEMIKALAKNGGVIHINFGTTFLDSDIKKSAEKLRGEMREMLKNKGLKEEEEAAKPVIEQFKKEHEKELYADLEIVANHIDHVKKLVGINHIGFGSDFDGVGDSLPTGLKDVSMYPNLIYTLLKRGYTEEDIAKICYQNTFRVWREVENVAKQLQK